MSTPTKEPKKRAARKRATNKDAGVKDIPRDPIAEAKEQARTQPYTLAEARSQVDAGYAVEAVAKRTGFTANQIKFGVRAAD